MNWVDEVFFSSSFFFYSKQTLNVNMMQLSTACIHLNKLYSLQRHTPVLAPAPTSNPVLLLCEAQKCTCAWLWCHISAFTKAVWLTTYWESWGYKTPGSWSLEKCSVCFSSHSDHKVERGTDDSSHSQLSSVCKEALLPLSCWTFVAIYFFPVLTKYPTLSICYF